jgi:peroxiredoxin
MQSKKHKNGSTIITVLFIMLFIALFSLLSTIQVFAQYERGVLTPDFTLKALDGEMYQLSQFNNKQDHLVLCFVNSNDSNSLNKLQTLVAFFEDYHPRESYQIIAVVETNNKAEETIEALFTLQENTKIPLLILIDEDSKVIKSYQVERLPAFLLLRADLHVRRIYDRFTSRQEDSFYQYLGFTFTSQKSSGNSRSSGCDDDGGVCPPPPGY